MAKKIAYFFLGMMAVILVDQIIKIIFLNGYVYKNECFTWSLVYNDGVAFSMFAFLGKYLKYLQVLLIAGVAAYVLYNKHILYRYALPLGLVIGGGISNLLDRFRHPGVVDFFHWHCGFDFPGIFNFADVMIDLGVALILFISWRSSSDK
jgi:signal peptidase II